MSEVVKPTTRPLALGPEWLRRLGIAVVVVHGHTVVRATEAAPALLGVEPNKLIGRLLEQLLEPDDPAPLKAWLNDIQDSPVGAGPLTVDLPATDKRSMRSLRLTAGPVPEGPASTRMVVIEEAGRERDGGNSTSELRRTLKELLDGDPVPTFVLSADHVVMHWNIACSRIIGASADEMVGSRLQWKPFYPRPRPVLADMVIDGLSFAETQRFYGEALRRSEVIPGALEATGYFSHMGPKGRWFLFTAAPIRNARGRAIGAIETLVDITELKFAEAALKDSYGQLEALVAKRTEQLEAAKHELEADIGRREQAEAELRKRYLELTELNIKLSEAHEQVSTAQNQLVQSEKMASIGQLAAGVAHEINNPIGYVFSNFGTLENYLADLLRLIDAYLSSEDSMADELRAKLAALRREIDLDYLRDDTLALMRESREGIERVRKIVQDLKEFSHVDASPEWQWADLRRGLESTLNIASNEIKYRAEVVREFGEIPQIECLPSQLNQVFMNLLVNAAHAMEGRDRGQIRVSTGLMPGEAEVWVEIADSGCGMSQETLSRIFDPFFTTKPVGKGTGLGLSLSYGIVQKHHGRIEVQSERGHGTRFKVILPIHQPAAAKAAA